MKYLDLIAFKVIDTSKTYIGYLNHLGVIQCTCLKMACDSKRLIVQRSGVKF